MLLLALLGGAAAWRPVLQLGSAWPAWKLMLDDAATHTEANVRQSAQQDYTPDAKRDRVDSLPGFGDNGRLPFGLYAGYITVDDDAGRALYYTLAESQSNAAEHPLVLWLNGGPGCSSIGGGFLSELGPFYPTPDAGKLVPNKHAWNRDANVLFIESPAFVGFSYSNDTSDLAVGDERTARDLVAFLHAFVQRFPAYQGRPFWISGESYGGHYVPNLALALLDSQQDGTAPLLADGTPAINLQGFLVGNAWTDPAIDNEGCIDFWWYHGLIADEMRDGLKASCNMSTVGPLVKTGKYGVPHTSSECDELLDEVPLQMGQVNIYDIYVDVCIPEARKGPVRQLAAALAGTVTGAAADAAVRAPIQAGRSGGEMGSKYDPCVDDEVTAYLNRGDVQEALHVPLPHRPHVTYAICSNEVQYSREDVFTSMLPVYHKLLDAKLEMLVFSGDVDGIVPLAGTRRWIKSLNLGVKEGWRPWYTQSGQVGGRVVAYDGLTFSTVRAAGHMVPYTQAARAAHLFSHWIHRQRL